MAIACLHGETDKRSSSGRPKRTPNPYVVAVGIDRAAPSNRRAGAQPDLSVANCSFSSDINNSPQTGEVRTLAGSVCRRLDWDERRTNLL
jgi:hypothetical protein